MRVDKDSFVEARLSDIVRQVEMKDCQLETEFLDITERSIAENILKKNKNIKYMFWGGFEEAERTICFIAPNFLVELYLENISAIRIKKSKKARELSHRDYLGSILALGINRSKVGDILVNEEGADIFVKPEMVTFLIENFKKVGRENIDVREIDVGDVNFSFSEGESILDTVASLRSDNIVSSMFLISRKDAVKFIKQGNVFVNNIQMLKIDRELSQDDKVVLRGFGRGYIKRIGGKSRKDRTYIQMQVYKK